MWVITSFAKRYRSNNYTLIFVEINERVKILIEKRRGYDTSDLPPNYARYVNGMLRGMIRNQTFVNIVGGFKKGEGVVCLCLYLDVSITSHPQSALNKRDFKFVTI